MRLIYQNGMLYSYQCTCGQIVEKDFPWAKPRKVLCQCGKTMERLIEPPKFWLKGEGFASHVNWR